MSGENVIGIPGWFGAENQGGGISLGYIGGNYYSPDLMAFHIDNPNGENHGYYRIGWDLNSNGNAIGWSEPKLIPGWFGAENQGGGIALGDIGGNYYSPDLVAFHIDNPNGENHGYYRIGWDLDSNGNATGWSDPKLIPGWFGAENQGGGIALGYIGGNYSPDLVAFHIDNPNGENHGYYRIGWDLDSNGNATGWSEPKLIPGWFGAENQGGGIALGDIDGNYAPDLVVYHIDNPNGENHGYYRIGWDLDNNGNVTGGWTDPQLISGWFGAENQGGGIALGNITDNYTPDLVAYHIDNPLGENHGYYRVFTPVSDIVQ